MALALESSHHLNSVRTYSKEIDMTILETARKRRAHRRISRAEQEALIAELSTYRTSAERLELDLILGRSDSPEADIVRDIVDRLPARPLSTRLA
jgi:hypothetical protein